MPKAPRAHIRKCARCRKDKARCEPLQRALPCRCNRCIRYDYVCSENLTAQQEKQGSEQGIGRDASNVPSRLQSDAACLQEMGDITSLLEVLWIMKSQQKTHKWPYSEREAKQLLKRLEDAVHESIKRARQRQSDRCWSEAEYLWRSIRMYGSADRLEQIKEIKIARTEAKSHGQKFTNRMIGLSQLVALHEQMGDFPAAEREQEILVARSVRNSIDNGCSPLHSEIQTLIRLYKKFQERVANLEVTGIESEALKEIANLSLLFRAIALECTELWVVLLKSNSAFVVPGEGLTLLHLSASSGSMTLITLLLSVGAEVDHLSHSQRSALHLAATEGHESVVKALLGNGADVDLQDKDGYSPLHFACAAGSVEVAEILLRNAADVKMRTSSNGFSPLHLAVQAGREKVVKLLLEHDSNLEEITAIGETILHLAVKNGHETLVKMFLEMSIEKDSADIYGIRPIHDAANVGIAKLLLDHGADANGPDKFSETPLLSAAWRTDLQVVKLLLQHKANINARDDQERTPLHRAVVKKRRKIASVLLENGAEANSHDCKFHSPLHEAVRSGEVEIVQLLLRHGADPQCLDAAGKSPLQYATNTRMQATEKPLQERLDVICSALKRASELRPFLTPPAYWRFDY